MTDKEEAAQVALNGGGEDGSARSRTTKQVNRKATRPVRGAYYSEGSVGAMYFGGARTPEDENTP
jgi:hypothetical protein